MLFDQLIVAILAREVVDERIFDVIHGEIRVEKPVELEFLLSRVRHLDVHLEGILQKLDREHKSEIRVALAPLLVHLLVCILWSQAKLNGWWVFLRLP